MLSARQIKDSRLSGQTMPRRQSSHSTPLSSSRFFVFRSRNLHARALSLIARTLDHPKEALRLGDRRGEAGGGCCLANVSVSLLTLRPDAGSARGASPHSWYPYVTEKYRGQIVVRSKVVNGALHAGQPPCPVGGCSVQSVDPA